MPLDDFKLTATVQVRHGLLWDAVKKCGSQAAAARYLGVSVSQFGRWLKLREIPSPRFHPRRDWAEVEMRLMTLLGVTLDEVFPPELAGAHYTREQTEAEREMFVPMAALVGGAEPLALPAVQDLKAEKTEAIAGLMNALTPRQRYVVNLYYGLDGQPGLTLEEIATELNVTRSYAQQVLARALQYLRHPAGRQAHGLNRALKAELAAAVHEEEARRVG